MNGIQYVQRFPVEQELGNLLTFPFHSQRIPVIVMSAILLCCSSFHSLRFVCQLFTVLPCAFRVAHTTSVGTRSPPFRIHVLQLHGQLLYLPANFWCEQFEYYAYGGLFITQLSSSVVVGLGQPKRKLGAGTKLGDKNTTVLCIETMRVKMRNKFQSQRKQFKKFEMRFYSQTLFRKVSNIWRPLCHTFPLTARNFGIAKLI